MNDGRDQVRLKWLTCLMFLMFAMTSDAVGSVIPRVIEEYKLSLKAASAFHYAPMIAIACTSMGANSSTAPTTIAVCAPW